MPMSYEQIIKTIVLYREHFRSLNIPKRELIGSHMVTNKEVALAHCHWMLDEMEELLLEDRREKVMRWLGFVQGVLFASGHFPIEALKNHNRPNIVG